MEDEIPSELVLPTLSARLLGKLVVFVCRPGLDIGDEDWERYIAWLRRIQEQRSPELAILTAAGGRAPSSAQRSLLSRELKTEFIRLAVLLSDPKLIPIVKISSWFMKSGEPFRAHEIDKALRFLGETDGARVRTTIRELGGMVYTAAG